MAVESLPQTMPGYEKDEWTPFTSRYLLKDFYKEIRKHGQITTIIDTMKHMSAFGVIFVTPSHLIDEKCIVRKRSKYFFTDKFILYCRHELGLSI